MLLVTGGTLCAEHCTDELFSFLYIPFKRAGNVLVKDGPVSLSYAVGEDNCEVCAFHSFVTT